MTELPEPARTRRDNGGDAFRAKLTDLDWIRSCSAAELRHALHALCWRIQRDTVDGFCTDPQVAQKVLIAARGVNTELRSRAALLADGSDDLTTMRKRISSSEAVMLSCQIALDLHHQHRSDNLGNAAASPCTPSRGKPTPPCGAHSMRSKAVRAQLHACRNTRLHRCPRHR